MIVSFQKGRSSGNLIKKIKNKTIGRGLGGELFKKEGQMITTEMLFEYPAVRTNSNYQMHVHKDWNNRVKLLYRHAFGEEIEKENFEKRLIPKHALKTWEGNEAKDLLNKVEHNVGEEGKRDSLY